ASRPRWRNRSRPAIWRPRSGRARERCCCNDRAVGRPFQGRRGPADRTMPVVHVSGIRKTYGRTVAVDEVSFDVHAGEIFGLIGPNGAGKTTTMECAEGLRAPDRGTISVLRMDPLRNAYALQERLGV